MTNGESGSGEQQDDSPSQDRESIQADYLKYPMGENPIDERGRVPRPPKPQKPPDSLPKDATKEQIEGMGMVPQGPPETSKSTDK